MEYQPSPRFYYTYSDSHLFLPDGSRQQLSCLSINDRVLHKAVREFKGTEALDLYLFLAELRSDVLDYQVEAIANGTFKSL